MKSRSVDIEKPSNSRLLASLLENSQDARKIFPRSDKSFFLKPSFAMIVDINRLHHRQIESIAFGIVEGLQEGMGCE
jgi:hypothetical protein